MKKLLLLIILWGLWYLAFATRTIVSPLLPIIENEFGLNHGMAGSLYLFAGVGATIASLATGFLAIKIGFKRLIIASFLLTCGACLGIYYAQTYISLAVLLFLFGLSGGFYLPCAIPMITSVFAPASWGRAISIHETAAGFSILSVPLVVAYALGFFEWRFLFVIMACFVAVGILIFLILAPDPQPKKTQRGLFKTIIGRADFWIVMILWVNCGMTSMGIYNIVPLYLVDEKGMDLEFANNLFGISRVGGFFGQVCIGFFLDRFSIKKIMFILVLASGLSTLGMALCVGQGIFVGLMILQGTFSVMFFPVGLMAISRLTGLEERGVYTGLIMAISQIFGVGLTPLLLGVIADAWSFKIGLAILGILTVSICPVFVWLRRV
ncbi:MAG: MFS transporter [Desulforhopalus sp.]